MKIPQVDCAVASVVAAVTEASESVRRVRVALRVPGTSVLFAAPDLTCSDTADAKGGDGAAGGAVGLSGVAVHAIGGKPRYIELSGLAALGSGSLRMRQLGVRVDTDCCIHYTVDGSDPVRCEDQVEGMPQAAQELSQQMQMQQAAPLTELSVEFTSFTSCSNNSTISGGSLNSGGSCSSSDGANSSSNKSSTTSSCGSPGLPAKTEALTQETPFPVAHSSSPQHQM